MGHGEPFEVPHYSKFSNWQSVPKLVEHQQRLARVGLKDPWIRNMVCHYDPKIGTYETEVHFIKRTMSKGLKPGLAAATALIVIEEAYSLVTKGHTSWGGH